MTPRQKECLDFIRTFWTDKGYAPSYEEIRRALGAGSKASVADLVSKLEERGYIKRMPKHARSIRLVEAALPPKPSLQQRTPAPTIDDSRRNK